MSEANWDRLVGKKIAAVKLDATSTVITFVTSTGEEVAYRAIGDCCSSSWIAEHDDFGYLALETIESVEVVGVATFWKDREENNQVSLYAIRLHHENGEWMFELRNESNGYYGGWMEDA